MKSESLSIHIQNWQKSSLRLQKTIKPPPINVPYMVSNWKLEKLLYEQYGRGRILIQPELGVSAFDALRTFLETHEKKGDFQITDRTIRAKFYESWNEDHGDHLTDDPELIQKEFLQPPWIQRP